MYLTRTLLLEFEKGFRFKTIQLEIKCHGVRCIKSRFSNYIANIVIVQSGIVVLVLPVAVSTTAVVVKPSQLLKDTQIYIFKLGCISFPLENAIIADMSFFAAFT